MGKNLWAIFSAAVAIKTCVSNSLKIYQDYAEVWQKMRRRLEKIKINIKNLFDDGGPGLRKFVLDNHQVSWLLYILCGVRGKAEEVGD